MGEVAISVMLAVPDGPKAVEWYKTALGATELWSLGGVAGLEVGGAAFFIGTPQGNGWATPGALGTTTTRVEVFVDDPDSFVARAMHAGATDAHDMQNYERPWGIHRQGGFTDPFGHLWFVGDKSPLNRFSA